VTEAGVSIARRGVRWAWLPWAAAILFFSVAPPGWILAAVPRSGWSLASTAGHIVEFGLFALLVWMALPAEDSVGRQVVASGAASVAFGLGIELIQLAIPYRSFDLRDWAADVGGTAAVLLVLSVRRCRRAAAPSRHR